MGDPWGIGGSGGGKPNIKQIVKKIGQKISKICEIGKNRKNLIFFYSPRVPHCHFL